MAEFVNLLPEGQIGYQAAWDLQRQIHAQVSSAERENTVLLLEHSSVYTAGKRTEMAELPNDGSDYVETDRGGKITWHGPGQLIGYPIYRLPQPIDVVAYVRWLEQLLIDLIAQYGIAGTRVAGRSGVWVGDPGHEKKIAAIGIRVSQKTTMHGFALNVSNSLAPYQSIIACGIEDAGITTMELETGTSIQLATIVDSVMGLMGEIGAHVRAN